MAGGRGIGVGDYADLLNFVESMVYSLIPDGDEKYVVTGDQSSERLLVQVAFTDDKYAGLFCGYKRLNIEMLLQFIRAQQIYPHDRYVCLRLVKPDGSSQDFWNTSCSKLRGRERSHLMRLAIQQREAMSAKDTEELVRKAVAAELARLGGGDEV